MHAAQRSLPALGSVFLGFDEIAVKLFDEIENSWRIALVHSACSGILD